MTTIDTKLNDKQNQVSGMFTEAKGVVREQIGNLTDDKMTQISGKRDQVMGRLQRNYSNSWFVRNSKWIATGTVLVALVTSVFLYIARMNTPEELSDINYSYNARQ